MKKLFLFLLISIFLISLVSADSCSPDAGYNRCFTYSNINTYGECTAEAIVKVQAHTVLVENGRKVNGYVTGKAYIPYKFNGDYFGLYENREWSWIWEQDSCSKSGCIINFDKPLSREGKYYLTRNPGDSYNKYPRFVAWDHDLVEKSTCWAWAGKGGGWGYSSNLNYKQIRCYDNSDCSSGQICDKSGDWKTWNCKTDPCKYVTCEDKCQNSIKYYYGICEDGECRYLERTCTYGCDGILCAEDPCKGVICDDKCENSIWFHDGDCVNGNCVYVQDTCQFGCQDQPFLAIITGQGMCNDDPCVGITCEDYCSGTSLFYDGKCIGGECTQFKEKQYAEECGWEPWYTKWYVWVGGVIFISLIALGIWYWRRKR